MAGFAASSQIFEASNHRRWVTGGSRPDQRICRVLIGFGFAGKIGKIKPDLSACFGVAVFASFGEIGRDLRRPRRNFFGLGGIEDCTGMAYRKPGKTTLFCLPTHLFFCLQMII